MGKKVPVTYSFNENTRDILPTIGKGNLDVDNLIEGSINRDITKHTGETYTEKGSLDANLPISDIWDAIKPNSGIAAGDDYKALAQEESSVDSAEYDEKVDSRQITEEVSKEALHNSLIVLKASELGLPISQLVSDPKAYDISLDVDSAGSDRLLPLYDVAREYKTGVGQYTDSRVKQKSDYPFSGGTSSANNQGSFFSRIDFSPEQNGAGIGVAATDFYGRPVTRDSIVSTMPTTTRFTPSDVFSELFGISTAYGNPVGPGASAIAINGNEVMRNMLLLGGAARVYMPATFNALTSSALTTVGGLPQAGLITFTAVGLHNAAQLKSNHILLNEDFNDWMMNPLIPQSQKEQMMLQVQSDSLFKRGSILAQSQLPQEDVVKLYEEIRGPSTNRSVLFMDQDSDERKGGIFTLHPHDVGSMQFSLHDQNTIGNSDGHEIDKLLEKRRHEIASIPEGATFKNTTISPMPDPDDFDPDDNEHETKKDKAEDSSNSVQTNNKTNKLLGKSNGFKKDLFERPGKVKLKRP